MADLLNDFKTEYKDKFINDVVFSKSDDDLEKYINTAEHDITLEYPSFTDIEKKKRLLVIYYQIKYMIKYPQEEIRKVSQNSGVQNVSAGIGENYEGKPTNLCFEVHQLLDEYRLRFYVD